jgi:hypothetical protein
MECINCGVEVEGRAKYCSGKCRTQASRARSVTESVTEKVKSVTVSGSVTRKVYIDIPVRDLTRCQLTCAIDSYRGDSWKGSVEFAELMRRLEVMSISELESGGYFIPSWKRKVG